MIGVQKGYDEDYRYDLLSYDLITNSLETLFEGVGVDSIFSPPFDLSPDGKYLIRVAEGKVSSLDLESGEEVIFDGDFSRFSTILYSPSGDQILVTSRFDSGCLAYTGNDLSELALTINQKRSG